MKREKIILAMSGGVDSSVAAHLLQEQGHEVTGAFLCLGTVRRSAEDDSPRAGHEGCCSPEAAEDARRVAQRLGIPFYVLDGSREMEQIIDYFAAEYAAGRTPNPCAMCNPRLKFGKLLAYADAVGADAVATGHHARILWKDGRASVGRALTRAKDQSYVLFGLKREVLSRIRLPIGEIEDKAAVRQIARELGLEVSDKPDSQEICFVPEGHYTNILRARAPQALRGGPITNHLGQVVGQHEGIGNYTIGQRRGLRVAAGVPMYVTGIDAASSTVTIGPREMAGGTHLAARGANWHRDIGSEPFRATVQVRYSHRGCQGLVRPTGSDSFEVDFDRSVHAITPGQVAAIYDGETLLGGGWIVSAK